MIQEISLPIASLIDFHQSKQLLVVTSNCWDANTGQSQFYVRNSLQEPWVMLWKCPVTLGGHGMAWGKGIHSYPLFEGPTKKEGDFCSPAGLFSLGPAFGKSKTPLSSHFPYLFLEKGVEAVDDPHSRYYNKIVNASKIPFSDWKSSEKMADIDVYEIGIVVNHNQHPTVPGFGSAIFIHLWRSPSSPTAGCTGMDYPYLKEFLSHLDSSKNPLLFQIPLSPEKTLSPSE